MEAFILADRVVTLQHMSHSDHKQPKYLKKYDLPSRRSRKKLQPYRSHILKENGIRQSHPIPELKVRNLLSTITEGMGTRTIEGRTSQEDKIDKYFSCQGDLSKNVWESRKPKETLLIRRIQPHVHLYDANLTSVSPRAPCWTFTPHSRLIGQPPRHQHPYALQAKRAKTAQRVRGNKPRGQSGSRASESEEYVLQKVERKIYEQMRERSGLGEQKQSKLQYCRQQLGKSTAQIFKKYHLINDAYFKKFLSDIQNISN